MVLPFPLGVNCALSRDFLLEPFEENNSRQAAPSSVYVGKRRQPKVDALTIFSRLLDCPPPQLPKSGQTGRRTTLTSSFRSRSPVMANRQARLARLGTYSIPPSTLTMSLSPSPPPSTVGLVRSDLRTSWPCWTGNGEPQVFVPRHTAAPTSFEAANDLARGFTPAPPPQHTENKDLLDIMLTGILDDTPGRPSQTTKRIREKPLRTKSGLVTRKKKPLGLGKPDDNRKGKALRGNPDESLSSLNWDTQVMSSKRVVGTAGSCKCSVSQYTQSAISN